MQVRIFFKLLKNTIKFVNLRKNIFQNVIKIVIVDAD